MISLSYMAIEKIENVYYLNQRTYIVCKLEKENKQYGTNFLL
jgi:hypothetical protein